MENIQTIIFLAIAIGAGSLTITRAKVTGPLRKWVAGHSYWLGELINCPFCTSHWLAFVAVAIYRPVVVDCGFYLLDLLVSAFVIVALASLLSGIIFQSISGITKQE